MLPLALDTIDRPAALLHERGAHIAEPPSFAASNACIGVPIRAGRSCLHRLRCDRALAIGGGGRVPLAAIPGGRPARAPTDPLPVTVSGVFDRMRMPRTAPSLPTRFRVSANPEESGRMKRGRYRLTTDASRARCRMEKRRPLG